MKSKPRFDRLKRSVVGNSNSWRKPRFTVSLGVTRQSSCTYHENIFDVEAAESFLLTVPSVGRPYRKDASPWPMGEAADVLVARVQFEAKVYAGVRLPQLPPVIWVVRN